MPDPAPIAPDPAPTPPGPARTPTGPRCAACDALLVGPYCAACGQRVLEHRHTLRGFAAGAASRLLNLERGLVHTLVRLTVAPGQVVHDYLGGRTNVYIHPLAYLLLTFAAFGLTARALGGELGGDENRWFTALLVFFVAGAGRLVFWRSGLIYAEHLVLAIYLVSHSVFLLTVGMLPAHVALVSGLQAFVGPVVGIWLAAVGAWLLWSYARVFDRRPLASAVGGLVAVVAGGALWLVAIVGIVRLLGR